MGAVGGRVGEVPRQAREVPRGDREAKEEQGGDTEEATGRARKGLDKARRAQGGAQTMVNARPSDLAGGGQSKERTKCPVVGCSVWVRGDPEYHFKQHLKGVGTGGGNGPDGFRQTRKADLQGLRGAEYWIGAPDSEVSGDVGPQGTAGG